MHVLCESPVNENCTFAKDTTYNQPDQLISYAFGLFWRDEPLLDIKEKVSRNCKDCKNKEKTGVTQKGDCARELHISSSTLEGAVNALLVIMKEYSGNMFHHQREHHNTRYCLTAHLTARGLKRLHWTSAELQDMPQTVVAEITVYCLLLHSGTWMDTDRQMARKKPNRFKKKSKSKVINLVKR